MQSTDYRGELPILASPRRAMERRPCGPRPSTPASAGRPTAAIHTDPRSKDKSWADGIGQPGKLGGRVRSLAYLRLKAAGASALGAGPAAPAGVPSPEGCGNECLGSGPAAPAGVPSPGGCGCERLGSGPAALMSPRSGLRPLLRLYFAAPAAHRHGTSFTRHVPTALGGSGRRGALRSVIKAEAEGHATFAEQRSTKLNL